MRRTIACGSVLTSLILVLCSSSSAQTVVINYTDRGWYEDTGFHDPSNSNYFVGDKNGFNDYRNFFVFDLTGVTQPITTAKLELTVPSVAANGFVSGDPSENYELHDVITSIASLVAGTGGVAAYSDLGSGVVYGSRTMTAADMGTTVEITLNSSAIAALNSNHGLFGIGGSITTLDSLPNNEYTFANTSEVTDVSQLRLTLVPEPSTLLLLGIGAISLLGYRKAKVARLVC